MRQVSASVIPMASVLRPAAVQRDCIPHLRVKEKQEGDIGTAHLRPARLLGISLHGPILLLDMAPSQRPGERRCESRGARRPDS